MKPTKALPDLLEGVRKNTVQAYKLLQTQNATELSKVMSELGLQNFSLSYYAAQYEFESKTLEAEYKRHLSQTFMEEREGGATEKNADAKARMKWHDLNMQYLASNKLYRIARATHQDVENLIDIVRTRISLLKMEMSKMGDNNV